MIGDSVVEDEGEHEGSTIEEKDNCTQGCEGEDTVEKVFFPEVQMALLGGRRNQYPLKQKRLMESIWKNKNDTKDGTKDDLA